MGLFDWLAEERQLYVVCDNPHAPSRDRLMDVLNKAGAKGMEPLSYGVGARVMLRRQDVGYIDSNGFTVRQEGVISLEP